MEPLGPDHTCVDIVYKHHALLVDITPCVVLTSYNHHTLLFVDHTCPSLIKMEKRLLKNLVIDFFHSSVPQFQS